MGKGRDGLPAKSGDLAATCNAGELNAYVFSRGMQKEKIENGI